MKNEKIELLLNNFKNYLLASDLKDKIAKIILFGSYAKGTASYNSDIDILIITTDGKRIEKSLMNTVFEFIIEYNAPLEVITLSTDDLFPLLGYFVYNISRYGLEVYSMGKQRIKKIAIADILNLSEEYLDSAKEILSRARMRLTIDAAYNAAELAAKALILLKQDDLPGSHGGVVSLFGQLYIKSNEIGREIGRELNLYLKLRNEARYKPNALLAVENARDIVNFAEKLIEIATEKNDL